MFIKFDELSNTFTLNTSNTKYVFSVRYNKYLEHRFYGLKEDEVPPITDKIKDFAPYIEDIGKGFSLDTNKLEFSFYGSGDLRTSALKIKNYNGDSVTRFEYVNYEIFNSGINTPGLPCARFSGLDKVNTLKVCFKDVLTGCQLYLYYSVFYDTDVIVRYFEIQNFGKHPVVLEQALSLSLDLDGGNYDMLTLAGSYGKEMEMERAKITSGKKSVFSHNGCTGHRFNPFFAVCNCETDELSGNAYGVNLIYSGNFLSEVEMSGDKVRLLTGINPDTFSYTLSCNETFISPQAILSFSGKGLSRLSNNFHNFVLNHIVNKKTLLNKPIVLNSWEARFFDINENLMLQFADKCVETGIDLLVMDDGWFGKRENDFSSLGDWYADENKFKNGLKSFVEKVQNKGIKFGIWVEPEMISPDSNIFRNHPNWVFGANGREKSLSRNQLCIDMANKDVLDYLKEIFSKTFEGIRIDYIKWDFNRYITEPGSNSLKPDEQGAASHKFLLGSYELLEWFNKKWPDAVIETCSGGGGRFDLGMIYYSSQIWTSDNTNPVQRIKIQHGVSFAYPASVMSCHVTNPKNICKDREELDYRYKVASGGILGYELDITKIDDNIKATIKSQIEQYKQYQNIVLHGEITRLLSPHKHGVYAFYYKYNDDFMLYCLPLVYLENSVKLKIDKVISGKVYKDMFTGHFFTAEQLIEGITVTIKNKEASLIYFAAER